MEEERGNTCANPFYSSYINALLGHRPYISVYILMHEYLRNIDSATASLRRRDKSHGDRSISGEIFAVRKKTALLK